MDGNITIATLKTAGTTALLYVEWVHMEKFVKMNVHQGERTTCGAIQLTNHGTTVIFTFTGCGNDNGI